MKKFLLKLEKETDKKYILYVLAVITFFESVILPVPIDILPFSLAAVQPKKWVKFGSIATIFSVLGAIFGYFLGAYLFDLFGQQLIDFYGYQEQFEQVIRLFDRNTFLVMFTAAFTPIPYKVFTLAGGALGVQLFPFMVASIIGRGLRYFAGTYLAYRFGKRVTMHIMKRINLYSIIFVLAVVLYFFIRKFYL